MHCTGMQQQAAGRCSSKTAVRVGCPPAAAQRAASRAAKAVVRVAAPEKQATPSSSTDDASLTDTTGVLLVQCPGGSH